jgi:hypothetical protein
MIIFIYNQLQANLIKKYLKGYDNLTFIYNKNKNEIKEFILNNPSHKYLIFDHDIYLIDDFNINIFDAFKCACVLKELNNKTIKCMWHGLIYFDLNLIEDFESFDWNSTETWFKKQIEPDEKIPVIEQLRWDKKNEFKTKNIYFIKNLWSLTWTIEELPKNLIDKKIIIDLLMNDTRNKNDKFFCEIYMNVFIKIGDYNNRCLKEI